MKSQSARQTQEYGKKLASFLKPGDIISINGELGSGKTVIIKGIARGLDVGETLVSPTFLILREYNGRLPLYHFDVYRISKEGLDDLGYEDYFYSKGVTVIEWGDKIKEKLPPDYLSIKILYGSRENERLLEFSAFGSYKGKLKELKKTFLQ